MFTENGKITLTAGEDLAARRRVKLSGATIIYAEAGEDSIGVTEYAIENGEDGTVRVINDAGTFEVTAAGVISAAGAIYGAADGMVSATPSGPIIGHAIEAATALNDRIQVILYAVPTTHLRTASVTLTAAQLKLLATTEIEIVAAPGADKFLQFLGATLILNYGSEVLAEDADNMDIEYDDGTGAAVCTTIECTGFIDQAADQLAVITPIVIASVTAAANVNKNLALVNNNDNFTGNATNDATLTVKTVYAVHEVGLA